MGDASGIDVVERRADRLTWGKGDALMRGLILLIGIHSCALGLLMLFAPRFMLQLFGFPEPVPTFFPSQSGVFLLILGVCYLLALTDPALVKVILISKLFAVVFLFVHSVFLVAPPSVWAAAVGDAAMLAALSAAMFHRYHLGRPLVE